MLLSILYIDVKKSTATKLRKYIAAKYELKKYESFIEFRQQQFFLYYQACQL